MGLREQAATDARTIVEDTTGFGWPIRLTDPCGRTAEILGLANDIAMTIDPDSGIAVTGRSASIAFSLKALDDAVMDVPVSVADGDSKPWIVEFDDIQGNPHTFKVRESLPDRALGVVLCLLEAYEPPEPKI